MNKADLSEITQAILKIIDSDKGLTSFQLANEIVKQVVVPFIEIEKAAYERLLFTPKLPKNSSH